MHRAGSQYAGQAFPHLSLEHFHQSFLSLLGGKAREHLFLGGEPRTGDRLGIASPVHDRPESAQYALRSRGLAAVVEFAPALVKIEKQVLVPAWLNR